MRYALYARKSSETEDRQIQSIEDQVTVLERLARERELGVADRLVEARSAKAPGQRPEFERLLREVERGAVDAILCWNLNRLSRNPVDSGRLSWMLQTGVLKEIHTPERVYRPEDNVLLFAVEQGMANQFILDLRKVVERGMRSKAEKGWAPRLAPIGYLNDQAAKTIVKDPERFDLVARAWQLLLTGTYSIREVIDLLNTWGLRTRATPAYPSQPLCDSSGYRLFTNIFYAGYFPYGGELHRGRHPAMLTLDEFRRVQEIVGLPVRRRRKHTFAFAGLLRCGRCGGTVTADVSTGHTGRGHYVYYHCGNRTGTCGKRGIREERLAERITQTLAAITIPAEIRDIALARVDAWLRDEASSQEAVHSQQQERLREVERNLKNLLDLAVRSLITDGEYGEKKVELQAEANRLTQALQSSRERIDFAHESMARTLKFASRAYANFLVGSPEKQRQIARALALQYTLLDGEVTVELNPALKPIYEIDRIEPGDHGSGSTKKAALATSISSGCPDRNLDGPLVEVFGAIRDGYCVPDLDLV